MARVVCLMNVEADRATFTWSEGPASFEPYKLDGMVYKEFKEIAAETREKLADLVKDYMFDVPNVPHAAFALAEAGHELYQAMFQPGSEGARQAKQVRKWLEKLAQQQEVDTLEIVVESPWSLPWNIVYDQPPSKAAFLSNDGSPDRWRPFWGLRYNLAGGRKVDPLRRMPLLHHPRVLLVVDPEIRDGLPADQQQRLVAFADKHQLKIVHTKEELQDAITAQRPDLLYWLSHASADALVLAGEPITPRNLRKLLRQDDDENFGGLAFLNACQTAEGGESGSFFEAFHSVGFSGMIGTEHQTVDQFANPLGLDFLEAFLERGEPVGAVLRKLRGQVPLGLLYGTYCPPDIRVDQGGVLASPEIRQVQVQGVALSAASLADPAATRALPPLPAEPYRSLAYYDREDRALFAGREDDSELFAQLLDNAATRILVLHGESGVGKSSFLHAGVIPYLEEECLGYRFIRDWSDSATAGGQGSVLFVRATNDLFGQLAQALCDFCQRPYEYQTPLGDTVVADLPGVLAELIGSEVNQAAVRAMLRSDLSLLGQIMAAIGKCLPFTAILVIDQGEEVFTLAQTPEDQQCGRQALDMLRRTIGASGDYKVIVCLRTEYYGRVIDRLRRGLQDTGSIREYLLTDFDEEDLTEAIRRPTSPQRIPHAAEVPREKYGFCFANGVAEEIARRVIRYTTQRRDSVLPLMQVICTQLYGLTCHRADRTITLADLEALGGIEGGMRSHVHGLLNELVQGRERDKRPVQKLFTQLYLKQPDGALTTALLPESEVEQRWTGGMPFAELLASCQRLRLLKVNSLRIGVEDEQRYVSLGHDALAKIAAHWDQEFNRGARLLKRLLEVAAVLLVGGAVALTVLAIWAIQERKNAETARDAAQASEKKMEVFSKRAEARRAEAEQAKQSAYREKAGALWQVATVARERNDPIKAAYHFLEAAEAFASADEPTLRGNAELAAQFSASSLVRMFPQEAAVLGVRVSHDKSRALVWSGDGTIQLWNVEDERRYQPLQQWKHASTILGAEFTGNNARILTWSAEGVVLLWDVTKQEPIQNWKHKGIVLGAGFTRDEKLILSWSRRVFPPGPGEVMLWDVEQARPRQLWELEHPLKGVLLARDESRVIAWNDVGGVKLWDVTTKEPVGEWKYNSPVRGVVFSRDESHFVAWTDDGVIRLGDVTKNEPLQTWTATRKVVGATLSPDPSRFLTWSDNGELTLWDKDEPKPTQQWRHIGPVVGASFSQEANRVVAWSGDDKTAGEVKLWDVGQPKALRAWRHDRRVNSATFSSNESRVLSSSEDGKVRLWDVAKNVPLRIWQHDRPVRDAVFMSGESRVLAWSGVATIPGEVRLWDVAREEPLREWEQDRAVRGAQFTSDELGILAWTDDGAARFPLATNAEPTRAWKQYQLLTHADFSRDGRRVLVRTSVGTVQLLDLTSDEPRVIWSLDQPTVGAKLTRDGTRVIAWSGDAKTPGEVTLWDVTKPELLKTWSHKQRVNGAMFTPDESAVLSWSGVDGSSGEVLFCDVTKVEPLQVWTHHRAVTGAVIAGDRSRVLGWSDDGSGRLWDVMKAEQAGEFKVDGRIDGAIMSRDGNRGLFWIGDDKSQGAVVLWDMRETKPLQVWKHQHQVNGAVFTSDESRVLSWSGVEKSPGEVKLWDVTQAEPLHVWNHDQPVKGARLARDDQQFLTWNDDGALKLWDTTLQDADLSPEQRTWQLQVRSAKQLDSAGQLVPLTWSEWSKLVDSPPASR